MSSYRRRWAISLCLYEPACLPVGGCGVSTRDRDGYGHLPSRRVFRGCPVLEAWPRPARIDPRPRLILEESGCRTRGGRQGLLRAPGAYFQYRPLTRGVRRSRADWSARRRVRDRESPTRDPAAPRSSIGAGTASRYRWLGWLRCSESL